MLRREEMKQEHEGAEEAAVVAQEVHPKAEVEEATQLLFRYVFGHIPLVLFLETLLFESGKIQF